MSDRYTKAALTVIAGAMVFLVVQNATGPSIAQQNRIFLCDINNASHCVSLVHVDNNGPAANDRYGLITVSPK